MFVVPPIDRKSPLVPPPTHPPPPTPQDTSEFVVIIGVAWAAINFTSVFLSYVAKNILCAELPCAELCCLALRCSPRARCASARSVLHCPPTTTHASPPPPLPTGAATMSTPLSC